MIAYIEHEHHNCNQEHALDGNFISFAKWKQHKINVGQTLGKLSLHFCKTQKAYLYIQFTVVSRWNER